MRENFLLREGVELLGEGRGLVVQESSDEEMTEGIL